MSILMIMCDLLLLPSACGGFWVPWVLPVRTRLLRAGVGRFTAYGCMI